MTTTTHVRSPLEHLPLDLTHLLLQPVLTWEQVKLLADTGIFGVIDRYIGGRGYVYQLEPANPALDEPIWRQGSPGYWRQMGDCYAHST